MSVIPVIESELAELVTRYPVVGSMPAEGAKA